MWTTRATRVLINYWSRNNNYWLILLSSYHHLYLIGCLEHECYFSICWVFHHPNWQTHIFQRGRVETTNQFNMSRGFSHVKLYLGVFHWAHVDPTHFDLVTGELRPLRGKKNRQQWSLRIVGHVPVCENWMSTLVLYLLSDSSCSQENITTWGIYGEYVCSFVFVLNLSSVTSHSWHCSWLYNEIIYGVYICGIYECHPA